MSQSAAPAVLYVHVHPETTIGVTDHPAERRTVLRLGDSPAELAVFLGVTDLARLVEVAKSALQRLDTGTAARS